MTFYVRVTNNSQPYPVYEGPNRKVAAAALRCVIRTLYGMMGTATISHNISLKGAPEHFEFKEGVDCRDRNPMKKWACPKDHGPVIDFGEQMHPRYCCRTCGFMCNREELIPRRNG